MTARGSASQRRRGGSPVVRLVQLAFVVGLAAVVAFGLYSVTRQQTKAGAPSAIAGVRLLETVTGEAAVAEMSSLHKSDIRIRGGWVGHYERGAIIFVGEAASEADAAQLVDAMTARITAGSSMFAHLGQQDVGGQTVHIVKSGDQMHYYYGRGTSVVWIAAPVGMDPGGFVGEALQRVS